MKKNKHEIMWWMSRLTIMGTSLGLSAWLPGKRDLRDPIDEHAKMHELGIAHGHGGSKEAYTMSGKLEKHSHPDSLLG